MKQGPAQKKPERLKKLTSHRHRRRRRRRRRHRRRRRRRRRQDSTRLETDQLKVPVEHPGRVDGLCRGR